MKTLKYHPTAIRNVLKKAGMWQAKWCKSGRVRGWGHWTSGFNIETQYEQVEKDHYYTPRRGSGRVQGYVGKKLVNGAVKDISVNYIFGDVRVEDDVRQKRLAEIRAALTAAGYQATIEKAEHSMYVQVHPIEAQ